MSKSGSNVPIRRSPLGLVALAVIAAASMSRAQVVEFDDPTISVLEGSSHIEFYVKIQGTHAGPVSVRFSTEENTAQAGFDYIERSGELHWPALDNTIRTFSVPIVDDNVPEPIETFFVRLHSPEGASLGELSWLGISIFDDDPDTGAPVARIDVLDAIADAEGVFTHVYPSQRQITARVVLDRVPVEPLTIDWTSDFPPFAGTLVFDDTHTATAQLDPVTVPSGQVSATGSISFLQPPPAVTGRRVFEGITALWFLIVDSDTTELERCAACMLAWVFAPSLDFQFEHFCDNPARAQAPRSGLARALPDAGRMLSVMTAYRDEILLTTPTGAALAQSYTERSGSLATALIQRPTFGYRVLRAQSAWIDGLDALVQGRGGQVWITAQMQSDLDALLDEFEELAEPATASWIADLRARLELDQLSGKTMAEFQQQVEELGSVHLEDETWGSVKARY